MSNTNWNALLAGFRESEKGAFGTLVRSCITREKAGEKPNDILADIRLRLIPSIGLRDLPVPYPVWQYDRIESAAYDQMNIIARLPVFLAGALMADAHPGYHMPIGGVAALSCAIGPDFVGVDIGCRMTASLFAINGEYEEERTSLEDAVKHVARFGFSSLNEDHPVMSDPLWRAVPILRSNFDRARSQLGTSGGGNHFVDLLHHGWCTPGQYAIVCHSGSRGIGAIVAKHYAGLAKEECESKRINVPSGYEYLDILGDMGGEYYSVMQLMCEYSLACHELILARFYHAVGNLVRQIDVSNTRAAIDLSGPPRCRQEVRYWTNAHNLATRESIEIDGRSAVAIVHRKGATPAWENQIGIIPGTSGSNSYIVRGRGNPASLNSASHGAGRPYSRTESKKRHDPEAFEAHMTERDIHYCGIDPDEAFSAYKNIEEVMAAQADLVNIVAIMRPFFVMMGGGRKHDDGD